MEGTSMVGIQPTMPISGDGFGFGGGSAWIMLIFAFLILGGGFGGFANRQNVATTEELSAGFNFAGVNNSLKDLMLGQANINQNIGNAICQSTYELASKIDNCCCSTKEAIGQVRYDMAVQNNEIKSLIQQNKIEGLQAQVYQLQLAQAVCGIPKTNPYGYGTYPYTCPNTCTNI